MGVCIGFGYSEATEEQLEKIKEIADELHISAANVLRYALDLNSKELKLRMMLRSLRRGE